MAKRKQRDNDEIENPKPRIGRGEYASGERIFRPSKKLQKKYKRVRETYKRHETEYKQTHPAPQERPLTIEEAFEQGIVGSKVRRRESLTSIIDKATILASQYGIDEAAEMLGVDGDFLDFALRGHPLSRQQTALIQRGYDDLILDEESEIDFDLVESYAEKLQRTIIFVNEEHYHGDELKDSFRYIVAEGKFDLVEGFGEIDGNSVIDSLLLQNRLSPASKARIIQWLFENDTDASEMIEAWKIDLEKTGGFVDDLEESAFWKWFRDTFYP